MADGDSFRRGFASTFKTGLSIGASGAQSAIEEKIKKQNEKAEKETKLANIQNEAASLRERISKAGGNTKSVDMFVDGISDIKDPDIAEKMLMAAISETKEIPNAENIKQAETAKKIASTPFDIAQEKRKEEADIRSEKRGEEKDKRKEGRQQETSVKNNQFQDELDNVEKIVETFRREGGRTPNELNNIRQTLVREAKGRVFGNADEGVNSIRSATQSPELQENLSAAASFDDEANEILNKPLPRPKTQTQLEREELLDQGLRLVNKAEELFNIISDKSGVGRVKGVGTEIRSSLGDILGTENEIPEVKGFKGIVDGLAVWVGRNVYRDDRVSQDDRVAYKEGIPDVFNTEREAKIMFDLLRFFANTDDPAAGEAIKLVFPSNADTSEDPQKGVVGKVGEMLVGSKKGIKSGDMAKPSNALKAVGLSEADIKPDSQTIDADTLFSELFN